jgi:hypothetical protein
MAKINDREMLEVMFEGTPHPLPGTRTIKSIKEALSLIPEMADGQIISTAIYASRLEIQAYLLRGACAAELRKRFAARLAGGRGRRDEAGVGGQARMRSQSANDATLTLPVNSTAKRYALYSGRLV